MNNRSSIPTASGPGGALSGSRGDVFDPPARVLSTRTQPVTGEGQFPDWFFVPAHGGTGAGLLAQLSWQPAAAVYEAAERVGETAERLPGYGMNAGTGWPVPTWEPTGAVVVVCRTTMRGLSCARDAAAQYLSGFAPAGLRMVGLVTVADQPGRLPRPVASAVRMLAGAYPAVWQVPYVPEYRLLTRLPDEPCPPTHPAIVDVLDHIRAVTSPEGPHP